MQYTEEDNKVYEYTDNKEDKAYVRYRVDIWNNRSTSEAAMQVDAALADLGLVRILCQDTPDPSGMKHKVMRYEGIIDMESEQVFWPA
nr:MAG TPA: tail component [Caudoviricetes sp.]